LFEEYAKESILFQKIVWFSTLTEKPSTISTA
jgi:hypothetical protein